MTGKTVDQMSQPESKYSPGVGIFEGWNIVHSGIDEIIPIPSGIYPYIFIEPEQFSGQGSRTGVATQRFTIEISAKKTKKKGATQRQIRELANNIIDWLKNPKNYSKGISVTPMEDIDCVFEFGTEQGRPVTRICTISLTMKVTQ